MPCDDTSESITVVLDARERLKYFLFEKLTCGKIVPLSGRLNALCHGMDIDALGALRLEEVVAALDVRDEETYFLVDKELDALQSAIANYVGSGLDADAARCKIESIDFGPESVTIRQLILAPKPKTRIPSCRTIYGASA
jgi:hypothetical protein